MLHPGPSYNVLHILRSHRLLADRDATAGGSVQRTGTSASVYIYIYIIILNIYRRKRSCALKHTHYVGKKKIREGMPSPRTIDRHPYTLPAQHTYVGDAICNLLEEVTCIYIYTPDFFDITVRNLLQGRFLNQASVKPGAAAAAGEKEKDLIHNSRVVNSGGEFYPFVVETFGH